MPWVIRQASGRRGRARRAVRRWTFDHSQGLTALAIGAATASVTVLAVLRFLPI